MSVFYKIYTNELFKISWVYLVLALINLRVKLWLTPFWHVDVLAKNHALFLQFQNTNNEQSRILQFYVPEALIKIFGFSVQDAYQIQRWVFVFLTFLCFHIYLKKWFDSKLAFTGVVFLSAVMPLTYSNALQESAPLLMLTFLLGLWTIREHQFYRYGVVLLIGAINNETVLILPAVFFFYNIRTLELKHILKVSTLTIGTCLPAFFYTGMIRYITRDRPHLGGAWHLPDNINGLIEQSMKSPLFYWQAGYLYLIFLFGVFWLYAFFNFSSKPFFLQRSSWMIPLFIIIHFLTGVIHESRQMLPLSFIIIPSAIWYLFANEETKTVSKGKT
ncbi:MAG: hypothetical protein HQM13_07370 [SAR324 cluster bacterium]|nr:hypothetical protein [SAR324 cluster bacterium]